MSNAALNWAQRVRGISGTSKAVLMQLANRANGERQDTCWPSLEVLAEDACFSIAATRNALRELERAGLLTIDRGCGRHRTSLFILTLGAGQLADERVRPGAQTVPQEKPPQEVERVVVETERVVVETERVSEVDPKHKEHKETKKNPKQRDRKPGGSMEGFEEFWRYFPRRRGRGEAEKSWPKAVAAAEGDVEAILCGLKVQIGTDALDMKDNGKFCPWPATWLNQKRWMDEVEPASSSQPFLL